MRSTRRRFLGTLAGLASAGCGTAAASGERSRRAPSAPVISVDVVLTEAAADRGAAAHLDALAARIEDAFADALPDVRVSVRYQGAVSPPPDATSDARALLDWWRAESVPRSADATLLLQSGTEWDAGGMAYLRSGVAVAQGAEALDEPFWQWIALHEIGHCLGLSHERGELQDREAFEQRTIMYPDADGQPGFEFSERAVERLRASYGRRR